MFSLCDRRFLDFPFITAVAEDTLDLTCILPVLEDSVGLLCIVMEKVVWGLCCALARANCSLRLSLYCSNC